MQDDKRAFLDLHDLSTEVLSELTHRVQDIDNCYRAVAEKMGQLYMCADSNKAVGLTARLDKPMRNASDNEQRFAAVLEELHMLANQRK
jgi:hypothetical protein